MKDSLAWNNGLVEDTHFNRCTVLFVAAEAAHCLLGHLTRKIVLDMTCNLSSGTLNPTIQAPVQSVIF